MRWKSHVLFDLKATCPPGQGWVYLCAAGNGFSRHVVGWAMADYLRTELVTAALNMAWLSAGSGCRKLCSTPTATRKAFNEMVRIHGGPQAGVFGRTDRGVLGQRTAGMYGRA